MKDVPSDLLLASRAFFWLRGHRQPECRRSHIRDGMVNALGKRCVHEGCSKRPSIGSGGAKTAELCSKHAEEGMVDVLDKKCLHEGCSKEAVVWVEGTKKAKHCREHAEEGMVNVVSKRCAHEGCSKYPSFGMEGTERTEFCEQHAREGLINLKMWVRRVCSTKKSMTRSETKLELLGHDPDFESEVGDSNVLGRDIKRTSDPTCLHNATV